MSKLGEYVLSGKEINSNVVRSIDGIEGGGGGGENDSAVLIVENFDTSSAPSTVFMTFTFYKVSATPIDVLNGNGKIVGDLLNNNTLLAISPGDAAYQLPGIDAVLITNGAIIIGIIANSDIDTVLDDGQGSTYPLVVSKGIWIEYNEIKNNKLFIIAVDYS